MSKISVTYESTGGSTPTTYTVTYNANGGTGTMTDSNSPYNAGATVTVLGNEFTRTGYDFDHWNTAADDSGTSYDEDDTFTINANTTLYAQWTSTGGGGGTGGDEQWVLTDLANLTSDDVFVIVGDGYAMTNNNGTGSAPATSAVTITGNEITSTVVDNIQWTVSGNSTNGYTFYPNGSTTTWLYCNTTASSSSNNNMRVGTGDRKVFELNSSNILLTKDDYTTRYLSIYNNADWRGYVNTNSAPAISFYKKVTGGVVPPSITANNVSIAYDATSGEIAYTLNNPVADGNLSVSENVDWISNPVLNTSENKVTFTTTANEATTPREGIITITYTYGDNETVSKDVTVTQAAAPVIYTTIPDLFAAATSTETSVLVTFNNWVVSGVSTNGKNVFVTDNNGNGFVIFDNDGGLGNTYAVNDILAGTAVSCSLVLYHGFAELTGVSANDLTITAGGTVTAANIAMADLAGVNTGALMSYENLTCSVTTSGNNTFYNLSDGTTTIQVYNTLYAFGTLTDGKTYNITGIYQQYNSTKEILPRSAADIEEIVPVVPTITVTPATASAFTYVVDDGPSEEQYFTLGGANLTSNITVSVTQDGAFEISDDVTFGYTALTLGVDNIFMVRMKSGLEVGNYNGTIILSSDGATDVTINLTGTVTAPEAPHVTWDLSIASYDEITDPDIVTWSSNYATMTNSSKSGGTSASNYLGGDSNNRTSSRFYNGNTLTLSPASGYTISSVVFTATSDGYASALAGSTWTNASATASESTVTVTPTDGTADIVAAITGTCGFTAVTVYYETATPEAPVWSTLPTPTVNVGDDYDITLSDYVSGIPAPTITLTSAVDGNNANIASDLYDYDNGYLYFQPNAAGTFTFAFSATNTAGSANASLVITVVAPTPTITVNPTTVNATANETQGQIEVTYTAIDTDAIDIVWYTDNTCATTTSEPDWIDAEINSTTFNVDYLIAANNGEARTAFLKVYGLDGGANDVYSELVTISQAAYVAPVSGTWVLTTLADLTPADVFVIVGNNGDTYAMANNGGGQSGAPAAVEVTVVEETLSEEPAANIQWNIAITDGGYIFYPAGSAITWLYCTNTNNGVRVGTNNANVFAMDEETNYLKHSGTSRYIGIYNSSDWRCYTNTTGNIANQTFSFYKKVSADVSYNKENIVAYSGTNDKYYLIASPVASVTPTDENGFLTSAYDLYYFDQSQAGAEWRNYKANNGANHFDLISGKGYLYANSTGTTLTFEGQPYNGNGVVGLIYDENATFAGWNLIGNPFATPATLSMPYYKMNDDGDGFTAKIEDLTNLVGIMEGVFVQATATNQTATFTAQSGKGGKNSIAKVEVNVSGSRGTVIDNAIVRFDKGETLEKFMLNPSHTRLYFTEGSKDYAIVRSNGQGEMPVNFKASQNGTYTLSVNAENLEMDYLHLIDNMTGANVDLLATPSYTFEAKTTDYASRFRLVFNANEENGASTGSETFAFFNGSEWMISNTGNATLQVVDVLGRVLSSETISGTVTVSLKETSGVYMLRLVNGNDVKVQKVVVR